MKTHIIEEEIREIIREFEEDLKKLEGKRIFVTGGNGFLPSYLVDVIATFNETLKNPCKIIIMNKNQIIKSSRLSHLINDKNVIFITHDVGKPFILPEKVDMIIHAASRANPKSFLEDPIDTLDCNVNGTRILLDYAKDNGIENFLFFSSAEIYGNPVSEFIPTPEKYTGNVDCTEPSACYTEAKRFSETLCSTFFRKYNVPVKMFRILLVYGPGMRNDGKVISDFFNLAIKKKEITIRDKGEAKRSFCYVSDAIRAILKIMFHGDSGEPYNVGNDLISENISILDLAKIIAEVVGPGVKVSPNLDTIKKQVYGTETRWVSVDKLRNLGWKPRVMIKEGLQRLKKHYEEENIELNKITPDIKNV